MWINWKRSSFGALLLATLSLLLFGCGDFKAQTEQKSISGVVSDPATGLALGDAKVTAFAVGANGVPSSTPLCNPASVKSTGVGHYTLLIPATYRGAVLIEATKPASTLSKLAKMLSLGSAVDIDIKAAVPQAQVARATIPPVMVSFATNMVVQYLTKVNAAVMSSDNIQKATIILETYFGSNFSQTPPPTSATDNNISRAQQDLIVSIQAINKFTLGSAAAAADVAAALSLPGGIGVIADQIKTGITQAVSDLLALGVLTHEYTPSVSINTAVSNAQNFQVAVPSLSDATPPAAPAGLTVSAKTANSVSLSWTASTAAGFSGYLVYRADSSGAYLAVGSAEAGSASFSDFTVQPASAYNYQIVAFDASRNLSAVSNTASVSTPAAAAENQPPSAPAGLLSKGASDTQVKLQWGLSFKTTSDGLRVAAARYNVYRDGQFIGFSTGISYDDFDVAPSTSYLYYVKAADADSNLSAASNLVAVRTAATLGVVTPIAPTGLAVQAATQSFSNTPLIWTASTSAATQAVTYNIYRGGNLIATGIRDTKYNDDSVQPRSTYVYTVTTVADAIESAPGTPLSITTPLNPDLPDAEPPTVPSNLTVVSRGSNSIALAWAPASKVTGDKIVAGYDILRSTDGVTYGPDPVGSTNQASFVDSSLTPNTVYYYTVRSFSSAGVRSASSLPANGKTTPIVNLADVTAPGAPVGLALVSPALSNAVNLSWTANPTEDGVAGYLVYRDGSLLADVSSALSLIDTTTKGETGYSYSVKAYDNALNVSEASAALAVVTPAPVPNTYTISGTITSLGEQKLFEVALTDGVSVTYAFTDQNGGYSFPGLPAGSYTVLPVPSDSWQFSPAKQSFSLNSDQRAVNFNAISTGTLTGSITYPNGTVIGGISFPAGTVIGGVTYPAGTIIGGVFYPTGTVIGGITYPNGVVIGGVSYPAGTVVGGIAFPVGAITSGLTIPSGTVIGGVFYPTGSVVSGAGIPTGVVVGGVLYPTGVVAGGLLYPTGGITGSVWYLSGGVTGTVGYPNGGVNGGVIFPAGVLVGNVVYPTGSVAGSLLFATGGVNGGVIFPAGALSGGVIYPTGSVSGGLVYPTGGASSSVLYPTGGVASGVLFPTGGVGNGFLYPIGAVTGGTLYPTGSVGTSLNTPTSDLLTQLDWRYAVSGSALGGALAPLTGALITATSTSPDATSYQTLVNFNGSYCIYLPAGTYNITGVLGTTPLLGPLTPVNPVTVNRALTFPFTL
jgi:chitodextrinase